MKFLKRENKTDLAYVHYKGDGVLSPIMFLGGFRSDMKGTKALYLENFCREMNQEFIRFDYSGHGQSKGKFEDFTISDWLQDAYDILTHCTSRPVMLVGSSMGGWISLLLAINYPKHVHSMIGLAAAPDFTTWMERDMTDAQKEELDRKGYFELPNDYDAPYVITKSLLHDGRQNTVLDKKISIKVPICLIQGKKDTAVPWELAEQIKKVIGEECVKVTYLDEADHRLSSAEQLDILSNIIKEMSG
jgi:pimeloyl-ACP methyl ester carboxylesterase